MANLQIGDKFSVPAAFGFKIRHYGIYVGPRGPTGEDVVHNCKGVGVILDHLSRVRGASDIHLDRRAMPGYEEFVAQRALRLVGSDYNLLEFNCEHFATMAQEGRAHSRQVETAAGIAIASAALGILHSLLTRSTYDPIVDRYRDSKGRFASS